MSRAFVKEPDGDQVADDQPELPQSPHPNYVTPNGLAQLKHRLSALEGERAGASALGEDMAGKLSLAHLSRQIRYLEGRLQSAILTDPAQQPHDRVCFGATVRCEDEHGTAYALAIVGEDEAEPRAGRISWVSPLASALLGARVGDAVVWRRPSGDLALDVLSVDYEHH